MSGLARRMEEDRRLAILELLSADPGGLNTRMIRAALVDLGHRPTADQQRVALGWLAEQGLVEIHSVGGSTLEVARLTERGADAAEGRARVPGVAAPRPR